MPLVPGPEVHPTPRRLMNPFSTVFDRRGPGRPSLNGGTPAEGTTSGASVVSAAAAGRLEPEAGPRPADAAKGGIPNPLPIVTTISVDGGRPIVVDDPLADSDGLASGVHAITKKTDYWLEREVGAIEKLAVEWAEAWAEKGLPRHDVPRTEPLEPEQVLAKRCAQTFRDWQLRVRTKMQDAIERASQQLGEHVGTVRARIARLQTLAHELAEREGKIEKIRRELEMAEAKPVRYAAFVSSVVFWAFAVPLAAVEFFANFPVFRLLLPLETSLEQAAASAAQNVDDSSWLAGIELFARNLVWNVDAVVVAFVAVIVLVALGKQLGKSLRPIIVLRTSDHPLAARAVAAYRRQHGAATAIALLGLACVIGFLWSSRGRIAHTAESRVGQDSVALETARVDFARAEAGRDRNGMSETLTRIQIREEALQRHKDAAAYARTVQLNNIPILLLNIGLVLTAAMLGFGNAHADLGDGKDEHPDLVKLRDRCNELRREMVTVEAEARVAAGQARAGIGHVQHLLRADAMRGWESKLARLEGVVPLFRGENARRRGLDPANVRAFDERMTLELPPPLVEPSSEPEPAEFARLAQELESLLPHLARLAQGARTPDDAGVEA